MKIKRSKPLDLSGTPATDSSSDEALFDAPEDLDLQQMEFRSDEPLGAVVPTDERFVKSHDESVDLPPLSSSRETPRAARADPRGWPFYLVAAAISCVWALAPIMFAWGYQRSVVPFENENFAFVVFAMLAIGPAALVFIAAYVLHQGARLAAETKRAQALADSLVQPAAVAALGAGSAVEGVRREIEQATAAATQAGTELLALRDVLAAESARLVEAVQGSNSTALALTQSLSDEREKMGQLAVVLDAQAVAVTDAIAQHARMVAEASDLAQTQIREAEAALAARAADLAAAAGEASDAARVATDSLDRQVTRLETASLGVGDQVRAVEDGLTEQRAALVATAHGLRADHEVFATEVETQRAQLAEILTHARAGAGELGETATKGADALRQMITSAADQLQQMAQMAAHERDMFSASAAQSVGAVSEIAAREREALELQTRQTIEAVAAAAEAAHLAADEQAEAARRSADQHAEGLREKVDQLSEAAFAAGQKADATFEARMNEARGMIEQTAGLVQEAGDRSAARLTAGVAAARSTLAELESLLGEVDERIARLPADAEARADAVRKSIERGMDELMASARKAADETQNIDAAFQDRVRRNYDMLSEAVRLMGVVAGAAGGAGAAARSAAPRPSAPPPAIEHRPAPTPADHGADPAAGLGGLRPRLKLTPTASDEEFKTVFDAAGGREPVSDSAADSWTWKELLSSMDDTPTEPEALAEKLIGEIETMGIDASALLPRARIEDIAAAIQAGDGGAAREIVRRLAPAALRRLTRRMMTERPLGAQASQYVKRYQGLIADAVGREGESVVVAALLGSDQGRVFLLFDAAVSELG